jgi:DNA-binding CsgD family transcriptional regulator
MTKSKLGEPLTSVEVAVLRVVALGFTNARVGTHLGVSEDAAKGYLRKVFVKLGARDRANAVWLAVQRGDLLPEVKVRSVDCSQCGALEDEYCKPGCSASAGDDR